MKRLLPILLSAGVLAACSTTAKSPDLVESIRQNLQQSGLKDVSVSRDKDKGVVTLTGHVASDGEKRQAESIAKSQAAGQIVADEIVVTPPGDESDAKTISSDLDAGIDKNLKAELLREHADKDVSYTVKAGVVTLTGTVATADLKSKATTIASHVPNVKQVIDELIVK
jgi:osmotically-inducible protein OsmY